MNSQPNFLLFKSFSDSMKWPYYQKYVHLTTLNHTTFQNLTLPILKASAPTLLVVNPSLNQTFLMFLLYVK